MSTPNDGAILGMRPSAGCILYDERVRAPDGREVITRLRTDGTMLLGLEEGKLREFTFFIDPVTKRPWVPSKADFVAAVSDSIANGEYDLDGGEAPCLESFLRSLNLSPSPTVPNGSPPACTLSAGSPQEERAVP